MSQTIEISALLPGMYVLRVSKQKGELKVTASGKVKDQDYIAHMIDKGVLEVEVDLDKSSHVEVDDTDKEDDYTNAAGLSYNQQLEMSLKLHEQAMGIHKRVFKRVSKGKLLHLEEAGEITEKLITTAFECDDALTLVTLLNEDSEYFLEHSINCALLMVVFGRFLGLEKSKLHQLGVGALLMDIGMMKLPLLLTQKQGPLTDAEETKMQTHIDIALALIEPIGHIDDISIQVIRQHHERLDGTGYPDGLQDKQISLYGRMAAIVDTYDSMTTERPYRAAIQPTQALLKMSSEELGLDQELINKFTTCIGAYPIGSVVKLDNNKLAMVIRLNQKQPLKPVVMVFYDINTRNELANRIDLSAAAIEIKGSVSMDNVTLSMPQLLTKALSL
ncbi:HD-GYP domain-containing protein [Paraglaciecola sp.]|uniref:HD-GYP domain-containing protein n=1 Tax=Paraglaciecola sp. TaxID=1920173 RepID=UPI003EF30028